MLPFIILALVVLHLTLLHIDESSNNDDEYIEFYFFYFIKDIFVFCCILGLFSKLVFFMPEYLSHPDNSVMALLV